MKAAPPGWPRIASSLFYQDAQAAIAWLVQAFGFTVELKVDGPDGSVLHSQLRYGEGLIMVAEGRGTAPGASASRCAARCPARAPTRRR